MDCPRSARGAWWGQDDDVDLVVLGQSEKYEVACAVGVTDRGGADLSDEVGWCVGLGEELPCLATRFRGAPYARSGGVDGGARSRWIVHGCARSLDQLIDVVCPSMNWTSMSGSLESLGSMYPVQS